MAKLLMITGLGSARDLASGKRGAFYNTLEEFHRYWERIDIIAPRVKQPVGNLFGNVFIHTSPWPLLLHLVFFIKKAMTIYREQKFDLMTVHEFPPFYNGLAARWLWHKLKIPYIIEIHHVTGYPKPGSMKERVYLSLMHWFVAWDIKPSKQIRVVNQKQVSEFLIKAGVDQAKISYIPSLYIDLDVFKPLVEEKKYDLIFIGRLVENKGINLFLETVKKTGLSGAIIGTGPLQHEIKLKIEKWKLKIDFHGWAKDANAVAHLINQSRLLVMPSYNEGGPRVVAEAMACGVPFLATPVGIVPDLISQVEVGEVIRWDVLDIQRKAEALLSDPERYSRYSKAGPILAKQFEKKQAIKHYADWLKSYIDSESL
ncbi:MAG: hypothetical protein A3I32_02535 [Candidatus Yanofskybacteria bacterium RIFCSPLOWO2_02_FULL_45_10]|uniref:Glycosyl transferase family 1 domain-containing protein n=3 Tax=Patescibacteria group TaxID=1783273 RepID=A0A1F8G465_9BACT|nr:MAG: Glycosyl transferase family 1 [Candidatus Daviesbacteria bacterium GW2011_GWB1_41_5]OGN19536.1 MAG: hypothetical protein A3F25_00330 [Candidatus Yanofskybacteria bacterium RIFCSPHIGHO2_12_FULL_45_19b]OGN32252.1 MAG: hypothetical protein A3I32_02535 [Candidatus Yanofskybacteria bacterium RIFCSPLOWO2_02_FULL_45_10]